MTHGWVRVMNDDRAAVYRAFDSDGALLYVGVSLNPMARLHAHCCRAVWYRFLARIEVEWHANIDFASSAEAAAIETESPIFNISGPTRRHVPSITDDSVKRRRAEELVNLEAKFLGKYPALATQKASPP